LIENNHYLLMSLDYLFILIVINIILKKMYY